MVRALTPSNNLDSGLTSTIFTYSTYGGSNTGCNGGWTVTAYQHVTAVGGLTLAALYPYNIADERCNESKKKDFLVTVVSSEAIFKEDDMIQYVLGGGTLSVVVDSTIWGPYKSGIFAGCSEKPNITHAVQIVGVNTVEKYWIIRNSWGDW